MIDSLKVGKIVYSKIGSLVSNRCYPLIAENGTTYPFIVYQRDSLDSMFCKDGVYEDEVNVSVKVVTDTYNEGYGSKKDQSFGNHSDHAGDGANDGRVGVTAVRDKLTAEQQDSDRNQSDRDHFDDSADVAGGHALCMPHCNTCVAPDVRAVLI